MARPPRFTADGILDAAAEVVAERWRDATVADVAARLGTPPNSVYYRFPTKDALFGSLWLRSIRRFHVGLLEALALPDAQRAAEAAAVQIPTFCRAHRLDAIAMTLYRQPDLAAVTTGDLREQVERVNDEVIAAMTRLAERRYGHAGEDALALTATACQQSPYGLVRPYLRLDVEAPSWLEDTVRVSSRAILELGDSATVS